MGCLESREDMKEYDREASAMLGQSSSAGQNSGVVQNQNPRARKSGGSTGETADVKTPSKTNDAGAHTGSTDDRKSYHSPKTSPRNKYQQQGSWKQEGKTSPRSAGRGRGKGKGKGKNKKQQYSQQWSYDEVQVN